MSHIVTVERDGSTNLIVIIHVCFNERETISMNPVTGRGSLEASCPEGDGRLWERPIYDNGSTYIIISGCEAHVRQWGILNTQPYAALGKS